MGGTTLPAFVVMKVTKANGDFLPPIAATAATEREAFALVLSSGIAEPDAKIEFKGELRDHVLKPLLAHSRMAPLSCAVTGYGVATWRLKNKYIGAARGRLKTITTSTKSFKGVRHDIALGRWPDGGQWAGRCCKPPGPAPKRCLERAAAQRFAGARVKPSSKAFNCAR